MHVAVGGSDHASDAQCSRRWRRACTSCLMLWLQRARCNVLAKQSKVTLLPQVEEGMNIAVYGADDINRNYYYLLQVMRLCTGLHWSFLNFALLGEHTAPTGVLCMLVAVTALLLCECAGCGPGAPPARGRHRRFRRHLQERGRSHRGVSTDFVRQFARGGDLSQQFASGVSGERAAAAAGTAAQRNVPWRGRTNLPVLDLDPL